MEREKIFILKQKTQILNVDELSDDCKIISQDCSNLIIKNGYFTKIKICGDFESIKFLNSRGDICDSSFSCREILFRSEERGCLKFKNCTIRNLRIINSIGGFIEYENPAEELFVSKEICIQKGGLELNTSDLICSSIVLKDSDGKFSDFENNFEYKEKYQGKKINILCDQFIIDGKCKIITFGSNYFYINSIPIETIASSIYKEDFERIELLGKLVNILKTVYNNCNLELQNSKKEELKAIELKYYQILNNKKISEY
jgi:hypothetical protein